MAQETEKYQKKISGGNRHSPDFKEMQRVPKKPVQAGLVIHWVREIKRGLGA